MHLPGACAAELQGGAANAAKRGEGGEEKEKGGGKRIKTLGIYPQDEAGVLVKLERGGVHRVGLLVVDAMGRPIMSPYILFLDIKKGGELCREFNSEAGFPTVRLSDDAEFIRAVHG